MRILFIFLSLVVCGCSSYADLKKDFIHNRQIPRNAPRTFLSESEICIRINTLDRGSIWYSRELSSSSPCSFFLLAKYEILESTDKRLRAGDILFHLVPMEGDAFLKDKHLRIGEHSEIGERWAKIFPETVVEHLETEYLPSTILNEVEDILERNVYFIYWGVYPETIIGESTP
ncbi:MAG: hypothetical protein K6B46_01585 [Opitutales bacterium]|nr:hypothetical protein [Opitutales bacterium]